MVALVTRLRTQAACLASVMAEQADIAARMQSWSGELDDLDQRHEAHKAGIAALDGKLAAIATLLNGGKG